MLQQWRTTAGIFWHWGVNAAGSDTLGVGHISCYKLHYWLGHLTPLKTIHQTHTAIRSWPQLTSGCSRAGPATQKAALKMENFWMYQFECHEDEVGGSSASQLCLLLCSWFSSCPVRLFVFCISLDSRSKWTELEWDGKRCNQVSLLLVSPRRSEKRKGWPLREIALCFVSISVTLLFAVFW